MFIYGVVILCETNKDLYSCAKTKNNSNNYLYNDRNVKYVKYKAKYMCIYDENILCVHLFV